MGQTIAEELYAEGKAKGREEGKAEGKEEGKAEGRAAERVATILRLGTKQLGKPTAKQERKLQAIQDADRLLRILDRLLDSDSNSWDDLLRTS